MTVLIAGGGVAGAAAACLLGRAATLVERSTGPHDKVCGEFLSAEALEFLARLDVDPAALGAAPIGRVRLVHRHRVAETRLPFPAMSLSRRVLDEALLGRARAAGATVLRGKTVRALEPGAAILERGGRIAAERLLLATGKHDLRGHRRRLARAPEDLVGLKLHLLLAADQRDALSDATELILLPSGYAGLQPIEGGAANLCLLLERERLPTGWPALQALLAAEAPHLGLRLAGSTPLFPRPLAIYRVPYGHLHAPAADDPPDLFRLGDQAAVIPSFSGDGVSIALHTAFLAVRHRDAGAYHAALGDQLRGQLARAGLLYRAGRVAPGLLSAGARLFPAGLRHAARLTRLAA